MKPDIIDAIVLIGVIMIGTGLWLVSPALSLITVGTLLYRLGINLARARMKGGGNT